MDYINYYIAKCEEVSFVCQETEGEGATTASLPGPVIHSASPTGPVDIAEGQDRCSKQLFPNQPNYYLILLDLSTKRENFQVFTYEWKGLFYSHRCEKIIMTQKNLDKG